MKRLILTAAVLAAACGGSNKVSVMLTDATGPFQAAVVTITEIDLVGSGGVHVLSNTKVTTNLLTLANDAATLVSNAEVPEGNYSELRFVITGAYVDTGSGIYASSPTYEGLPAGATVAGNLQMPSLATSGLKVDMANGSLDVNTDSKVLLVDFDVAQSFGHAAGNSGNWVMHPVIKGADITVSGDVNVAVSLAAGVTLPAGVTLANFSATLTNADNVTETLALSATGTATFKFLLPGTYSVGLTAPGAATITTSPAIPLSVTVGSGAAANASLTITGATF